MTTLGSSLKMLTGARWGNRNFFLGTRLMRNMHSSKLSLSIALKLPVVLRLYRVLSARNIWTVNSMRLTLLNALSWSPKLARRHRLSTEETPANPIDSVKDRAWSIRSRLGWQDATRALLIVTCRYRRGIVDRNDSVRDRGKWWGLLAQGIRWQCTWTNESLS